MAEPEFDESLVGDRSGIDLTTRWFGGILAPVVMLGLGLYTIANQYFPIPLNVRNRTFSIGRSDPYYFEGASAVAIGVMILFTALFLHSSKYWGLSPRYPFVGDIGKLIGILGIIAALLYFLSSEFISVL